MIFLDSSIFFNGRAPVIWTRPGFPVTLDTWENVTHWTWWCEVQIGRAMESGVGAITPHIFMIISIQGGIPEWGSSTGDYEIIYIYLNLFFVKLDMSKNHIVLALLWQVTSPSNIGNICAQENPNLIKPRCSGSGTLTQHLHFEQTADTGFFYNTKTKKNNHHHTANVF